MKLRADALASIQTGQPFDLCIIGGGATGAGCALDAQLRGLRTVLLEADDFASGASGASTKIVHGGVRYLQQAVTHVDLQQLSVVKRALRERALMLANAPYLTRTLDFVVPCYSPFDLAYYAVGMKMYDWLAGTAKLSPSRRISSADAIRLLPGMNAERLSGAIVYSDGQFDDCRYCIALMQTFTRHGGEAVNHASVGGFEKDAAGTLQAIRVRDELSQRELVVRARSFVNATGAGADKVRELARPGVVPRMSPSKGVHIVLPLDGFSADAAMLIPSTEDSRVIFAIPWQGRLLVGTTDDPANPDGKLSVTKSEAEYLLRHLNRYIGQPFSPSQIVGTSAGLRPLLKRGDGRATGKLVRDHEVELDEASGLISILGGKWTTYRAMAEDTIDAVEKQLGRERTPCRTAHFPLAGSERVSAEDWTRQVSPETALHLKQTFGADAGRVIALAAENLRWLAPLIAGSPAIQAEVVYSIREEMAATIEDVLARRIGLQLLNSQNAMRAAPAVGNLLSDTANRSNDDAVHEYASQIRRQAEAVGFA